jgi:hypothetical protein
VELQRPDDRKIVPLAFAVDARYGGFYAISALRVAAERSAAMSERKTFDIGRNSRNGQFIPVREAERRPTTTTVERVPKPGHGDTKNEPRRR